MPRTAIAQIAKLIGQELESGAVPSEQALATGPMLAEAGASTEIVDRSINSTWLRVIGRAGSNSPMVPMIFQNAKGTGSNSRSLPRLSPSPESHRSRELSRAAIALDSWRTACPFRGSCGNRFLRSRRLAASRFR
jgi:hypothetical protein